jgi:hypothetical protein
MTVGARNHVRRPSTRLYLTSNMGSTTHLYSAIIGVRSGARRIRVPSGCTALGKGEYIKCIVENWGKILRIPTCSMIGRAKAMDQRTLSVTAMRMPSELKATLDGSGAQHELEPGLETQVAYCCAFMHET